MEVLTPIRALTKQERLINLLVHFEQVRAELKELTEDGETAAAMWAKILSDDLADVMARL